MTGSVLSDAEINVLSAHDRQDCTGRIPHAVFKTATGTLPVGRPSYQGATRVEPRTLVAVGVTGAGDGVPDGAAGWAAPALIGDAG
jgi:hypothetical protein